MPFVLVWGLLLVPTFLLFTAFVSAVQAVTSNRYMTYTVGLGTMILSGWAQARGHMNWVWNWDLWSVLRWTDTDISGLYRATIGQHPQEFLFAVNVPTATESQQACESDLARTNATELQAAFFKQKGPKEALDAAKEAGERAVAKARTKA